MRLLTLDGITVKDWIAALAALARNDGVLECHAAGRRVGTQ
jgi:hypothetical protein